MKVILSLIILGSFYNLNAQSSKSKPVTQVLFSANPAKSIIISYIPCGTKVKVNLRKQANPTGKLYEILDSAIVLEYQKDSQTLYDTLSNKNIRSVRSLDSIFLKKNRTNYALSIAGLAIGTVLASPLYDPIDPNQGFIVRGIGSLIGTTGSVLLYVAAINSFRAKCRFNYHSIYYASIPRYDIHDAKSKRIVKKYLRENLQKGNYR